MMSGQCILVDWLTPREMQTRWSLGYWHLKEVRGVHISILDYHGCKGFLMTDKPKPRATSATLTKYARLDRELRAAENKVKKLKAQRTDVEARVLEYFQKTGVDSFKIGGITIYLRRQLWASTIGDPETVANAFKSNGLGHMVAPKVNTQTLSSWVREQEKDNDCNSVDEIMTFIPPDIAEVIKVSEVFKIQTRKGN